MRTGGAGTGDGTGRRCHVDPLQMGVMGQIGWGIEAAEGDLGVHQCSHQLVARVDSEGLFDQMFEHDTIGHARGACMESRIGGDFGLAHYALAEHAPLALVLN